MSVNDHIPDTTPTKVRKIPCEVYSRIVGYLRPVQNWHQGKQQEFRERKTFDVEREDVAWNSRAGSEPR
ncbi:MAG: anaerobic ribonucleoside-triphosphate reductase [Chloroflexi bacterium]|nr:anaerobic ribonucleoside-triphosphate reductase [Chloroflexota bacterium]